MFNYGKFKSHSGFNLWWKIECDDLTNNDIESLAKIISSNVPFQEVHGVPRGGLLLAAALKKYCRDDVPTALIVDDVLTSGRTITEFRDNRTWLRPILIENIVGVVIFSRCGPSDCPSWVKSVFELNPLFH